MIGPFKNRRKGHLRELYRDCEELKEYEEVLIAMLNEFYAMQSRVEILSDAISSKLSQNEGPGHFRDFLLLIGTKDRPALEIIFSIFHEYGHLNQDRPTEQEKVKRTKAKYLRECHAWELGENKFLEFTEIIPHLEYFKAFRAKRQQSYANYID